MDISDLFYCRLCRKQISMEISSKQQVCDDCLEEYRNLLGRRAKQQVQRKELIGAGWAILALFSIGLVVSLVIMARQPPDDAPVASDDTVVANERAAAVAASNGEKYVRNVAGNVFLKRYPSLSGYRFDAPKESDPESYVPSLQKPAVVSVRLENTTSVDLETAHLDMFVVDSERGSYFVNPITIGPIPRHSSTVVSGEVWIPPGRTGLKIYTDVKFDVWSSEKPE